MALDNCPHMTARCPHYRRECNDQASKQCHYIQRTTASMMTVVASLHAIGVDRLSPAMREYLAETEDSLRRMGISYR
jgi:hypothetical protein